MIRTGVTVNIYGVSCKAGITHKNGVRLLGTVEEKIFLHSLRLATSLELRGLVLNMGPHKLTLLTVITKRDDYSTNTRLYPTSDILLLNIHWFQYGSTSQSLIPMCFANAVNKIIVLESCPRNWFFTMELGSRE